MTDTEGNVNTTNYLCHQISNDPSSSDLRWCLLWAAANSYRHDSALRPFPPMFKNDSLEGKDRKRLLETLSSLSDLPTSVAEMQQRSQDPHALEELLAWALKSDNFSLKSLSKSQLSLIKRLTEDTSNAPAPHFLFEVIYSDTAETRFDELRQDRDVLYAYHGSRLENFHSILNNGLVNHMNKTSLFGEGTYLSGDLSVSLLYSPGGSVWPRSRLGQVLSCIAVCQMIDDPAVKSKRRTNDGTRKQLRAVGTEAGDVPEKYYVVTNDKVIRVKYLLVYAQKAARSRLSGFSWFGQHKFAAMMIFYVIILLLIGVLNSNWFSLQIKKLYRNR